MRPHTTACPGAPAGRTPGAPAWAGAAIFRLSGEASRRHHPVAPMPHQVMHALEACRTAPLGGHAAHWPRCGFARYAHPSCRHRPGPKGQTFPTVPWVADRTAEGLPVPYFHLVFPLPHILHPLRLPPQRPLLPLLGTTASQTLVPCGQRTLGGQIGCPLGLHAWEQTLGAHCHGHGLLAAGALAAPGVRWIAAAPRGLFPGRALSPVFRGQVCAALARRWTTDALPCPEEPPSGGRLADCAPLRAQRSAKEWVGDAKPPWAGPEHSLDDVGRETPRVAIANHRLLDGRNGRVRGASRNRREGHRAQAMTRDADACRRRCLWHVLPRGGMPLRHYGCRANRHKARTLGRCRDLWGPPPTPAPRPLPSVVQWRQESTGIDLTPCPHCGAKPRIRRPLPRLVRPATPRGAPVEVPIDDASCSCGVCPSCRRRDPHGCLSTRRGDGRVDGGMSPLTGETSVPFLPVAEPRRGLETLCAPSRLPRPSAGAAEALRPV